MQGVNGLFGRYPDGCGVIDVLSHHSKCLKGVKVIIDPVGDHYHS